MNIGYYPGCTLHTTGKEYDLSVRALLAALGFTLQEIPDWNCCGATSAHGDSEVLSYALPLRNLALAEAAGLDRVAVPCAACYNTLAQARAAVAEGSEAGTRAREIVDGVGRPYAGTVDVVHPLQVVGSDEQLEVLRSRARPLTGLRVATYYGCLLARPAARVAYEDSVWPKTMDRVLQAVGCDVVRWSYRTECCGGSLGISRTDLVEPLSGRLQDEAVRAGADVIVTACPLCQSNLEGKRPAQHKGPWLPVMYFTELAGIALDIRGWKRWLRYHLVPPGPALKARGIG